MITSDIYLVINDTENSALSGRDNRTPAGYGWDLQSLHSLSYPHYVYITASKTIITMRLEKEERNHKWYKLIQIK